MKKHIKQKLVHVEPVNFTNEFRRKVEKSYRITSSLCNQKRIELMEFIHWCKNGRVKVSEIYAINRWEQSETSKHLGILRSTGMVIAERVGRNIYYSLNYKKLYKSTGSLMKFSKIIKQCSSRIID